MKRVHPEWRALLGPEGIETLYRDSGGNDVYTVSQSLCSSRPSKLKKIIIYTYRGGKEMMFTDNLGPHDKIGNPNSWEIGDVLFINLCNDTYYKFWEKLFHVFCVKWTPDQKIPCFIMAQSETLKIKIREMLSVQTFCSVVDYPPPCTQSISHTTKMSEHCSRENSACVSIATDGACKANGKQHARAGFCALVLDGHLKNLCVKGIIEPYSYGLYDSRNPLLGFVTDTRPALPTNNRAEYLAGCWALLLCLRLSVRTPPPPDFQIITDSNLFIKTMTMWLPNRRQKGTASNLKNYDLIEIAEKLMQSLQKQHGCAVNFIHVKSHQSAPRKDATRQEYEAWLGNKRVDTIAQEICHKGVEEIGSVVMDPIDGDFWFYMDQAYR